MTEERRYDYRDSLRLAELELVLPVLESVTRNGARLLEIGAGTGIQSRFLADKGYEVESVDLEQSAYSAERVFPITDYDGVHLPFDAGSFDVVFSSNVMEHVEEFPALQADIHRVLKPDGVCVHVVPNTAWVVFNLPGHWLTLPRTVWRAIKARRTAARAPSRDNAERSTKAGRSAGSRLMNQLIPESHGVFSKTMFAEIWQFSDLAWTRRFNETGWYVERRGRVGLFYTGHEIFGPRLSFAARRRLSSLQRGACNYYVLRDRRSA